MRDSEFAYKVVSLDPLIAQGEPLMTPGRNMMCIGQHPFGDWETSAENGRVLKRQCRNCEVFQFLTVEGGNVGNTNNTNPVFMVGLSSDPERIAVTVGGTPMLMTREEARNAATMLRTVAALTHDEKPGLVPVLESITEGDYPPQEGE